ncbi:MAG: hypothetical protein ABIO70_08440 [Pseudomonadota bacterium]
MARRHHGEAGARPDRPVDPAPRPPPGGARALGDRPDFWRTSLLRAFRLAALLHDIAYPDQLAEQVAAAAGAVRPRAPFEPSAGLTAAGAADWLASHLCARGLCTRAVEAAWASHGPRSAYALLRLAEEVDRFSRRPPEEVLAHEWAASAIFLHDLDGLWAAPAGRGAALAEALRGDLEPLRPSVRRDPLAWLLALADQLQEFGRMRYEPDTHDPHHACLRMTTPCQAVEVDAPASGPIHVIFYFDSGVVAGYRDRLTPGGQHRSLERWLDSTGVWTSLLVEVEPA